MSLFPKNDIPLTNDVPIAYSQQIMSGRLQYRPEIDGLRAIAVMAVLLYHAELFIGKTQLFAGGFLGVDVFFVISGYLITSLILTEYQSTGSFSFPNFYERRARRLLPALLTVMLASLPVAWFVLMPTQLIDFSKSLISSIFFASNLYWNETLHEYGTESALLKPFLHTWSLAVEEQFYILFPIILLGALRYLTRHSLFVLTAFLLISLGFAEFLNDKYPSFSFYMLPTRFWELMIGAFLAHVAIYNPIKKKDTIWQRMSPFVGISLIIFSIHFVPFNEQHPGIPTLVPVLGTALIIWFSGERNFITTILASRVFVAIGLISYSLYLWHYPIFAFGRIIEDEPGTLTKASWFAASFILSFATYKLIERPFRNRNMIRLGRLVTTLSLATVIVLGFAGFSIHNDGLKDRFPKLMEIFKKNEFDNLVLQREAQSILTKLAKENGFNRHIDYSFEGQWFSNDPFKSKLLILGNSHSRDLFNALYQNRELFNKLEFGRYPIELYANDAELKKLFRSPVFISSEIILISTRFVRNQQPSDSNIKALPGFLTLLKKYKKRMIVASNTMEFYTPSKGKTLFDVELQNSPQNFNAPTINQIYFQKRNIEPIEFNKKIKIIAAQFNLPFLEKADFVCDEVEKICDGVTPDGYKSFFDYGHWTLEGAKHFGKKIHDMNWLKLVK